MMMIYASYVDDPHLTIITQVHKRKFKFLLFPTRWLNFRLMQLKSLVLLIDFHLKLTG